MSHQTHDTIASAGFREPAAALLDAARLAKSKYSAGKQALHIIFVNLILFQKEWQAVVSVTALADIDGDGKPAILFGHLPFKYLEYYDDLLPEFDHLNIIDNENLWRDIKKYLLDVHFYQAVHYGDIQRMTESEGGRGYFKARKESNKIEGDFHPDIESSIDQEFAESVVAAEHKRFQEDVKSSEDKTAAEDYAVLNRNQREGRVYKNLVFDLRK